MPRVKEKRKRPLPVTAWGPGNPPPKSPGAPRHDHLRPILEANPGIPERLACLRAAVDWSLKRLPKNGTIRHFLMLQKRNPREFQATWDKMEREWEEEKKAKGREEGERSEKEVEKEPLACVQLADEGSKRAEELLSEFLDRHFAAAVEKTGGL